MARINILLKLLFTTGILLLVWRPAYCADKNELGLCPQCQEMYELVDEAEKILIDKNKDIDDFGRLLDMTWKLKRQTGKAVSTNSIDGLYAKGIEAGDMVEVDFDSGMIYNKTKGTEFKGQAFPPFMQEIIKNGGLINNINKRMDVLKRYSTLQYMLFTNFYFSHQIQLIVLE